MIFRLYVFFIFFVSNFLFFNFSQSESIDNKGKNIYLVNIGNDYDEVCFEIKKPLTGNKGIENLKLKTGNSVDEKICVSLNKKLSSVNINLDIDSDDKNRDLEVYKQSIVKIEGFSQNFYEKTFFTDFDTNKGFEINYSELYNDSIIQGNQDEEVFHDKIEIFQEKNTSKRQKNSNSRFYLEDIDSEFNFNFLNLSDYETKSANI